MSEAWLTRTQSRGELDTSSSVSLARSIYGSQAYFDGGNSSYQGSEVNLFRTTSQVSNPSGMTRHLNRPKSSPARTIAERNQKLRPSSAMPSSFGGGHQFNKSRPGSAMPTYGRPKSSLQRGSRPTSALQYAAGNSQMRRRPQTAAPWATPLIEVEDFDEFAEAGQSTSRIRSANPVTLNNVPEYIKVWEGKPLLLRDHGMKHFDRKPWQRPKSDYGLRPGGWRRRKKTGQDGMTPVTSVTEVNGGSHDRDYGDNDDHKSKLAWGQDSGLNGNKDYKSSFDDGRGGGKGLGDGHGVDQRTSNYGDGSGSSSNVRSSHDDSDLWASRIQPPKEDSDSDDDYFKKSEGSSGELTTQLPSVTNLANEKPESISRSSIEGIELPTEPTIKLPPVTAVIRAPPPPAIPWPVAKGDTGRSVLIQLQQKPVDSQWMNYRMALARHSTRFELPMDMKRLETMSPEQYLCTHCIISDRRVQHYRRIFTAAKKRSQPLQAAADYLSYKELVAAIIDAHYESLSEEEIHKVIDVVCLSPEQSVDFTLFCGVCALTERMYRDKFISSRSSGAVQEYGRYKEIVEDADFEALDWKLRGCKISKSLRNLFSQL